MILKTFIRQARSKEVAIQTIKSIALRRWTVKMKKKIQLVEITTDKHPPKRAIYLALTVILNSSSDATLLEVLLRGR